jgi:hypothetical protein
MEEPASARRATTPAAVTSPPGSVERAVGLLLGSPEFQRR